MYPKVSLILTTYNSEENLPTTLSSIESQDYPNIEVVIKDGGSTDKTLEIIEDFQKRHSDLSPEAGRAGISVVVKSEKDSGIYDAMNRGIELSSGEIIACFNDRFTCNDAISKLVRALQSDDGKYDAVHADLVYAEGDKIIRTWHMGQGSIKKGWMPGHPTLYVRRSVYERYGLYKTDYKIAADYEFMVRILKDKTLKLNYVEESLISMYYGGTSSSSLASYIKSFGEGFRALRENHIFPAFFITVLRTIKVLRQF